MMFKGIYILGLSALLTSGVMMYNQQPAKTSNDVVLNEIMPVATDAGDTTDTTWQCPYGNSNCVNSESCGQSCYNGGAGCRNRDSNQVSGQNYQGNGRQQRCHG